MELRRRLIICAFSLLFVFPPALLTLPEGTEGTITDSFGSGKSVIVRFPSDPAEGRVNIDASNYVSVDRNSAIASFSLNISTYDSVGGNYVTSPALDIGAAGGDVEWIFEGQGYGKFGHQEYLSSGLKKVTVTFPSGGGSTSSNTILLPENTEIASAEISVRGRFVASSIERKTLAKDISPLNYRPRNLHIGDLTGDGYPDLIIGDAPGDRIILCENPRNMSRSWNFTVIATGIDNPWDFEVVDLDEDGDLDIVVGGYGSYRIYWIKNNNNASFTRTTIYSSLRYCGVVRVGDIDKDGFNDIVTITERYYYWYNRNKFILWFEAPDNYAGSWTVHTIRPQAPYYYYFYTYYAMDLGDINGDGYLDVVYGGSYYSYNGVYWCKNPGSTVGSATSWTQYTLDSGSHPYGLKVADLDGDDDMDVVVAESGGNNDIFWLRNTGTTSNWPSTVIDSNFPSGRYVEVADMDGDNDLDVIASCSGGSPYRTSIYLQTGTPSQTSGWTRKNLDTGVGEVHGIGVGDLDKDGHNDTVISGYHTAQIKAFFIDPSPTFTWDEVWIDKGGYRNMRGVDTTDLDGDGDLDIVFTAYDSNLLCWAVNDGTPYDTNWTVYPLGTLPRGNRLFVADIDEDGDMDAIATSGYQNSIIWVENNGNLTAGNWNYYQVASDIGGLRGFSIGDIDGDGDIDVAVTTYYYSGGRVLWYENPSDPKRPWIQHVIASGLQYPSQVWLDDGDRDGDLDAFVCYGAYGSGGVNCYINVNPTGNWPSFTIGGGLYYPRDVRTWDITGNGYPDVVVTEGYYYGAVRWYENPGRLSGTWRRFNVATTNYNWYLWVGDLGDDGYADVVYTRGSYSSGDSIYWCEVVSSPTSTWQRHSLGSVSGAMYPTAAPLTSDDVGTIMIGSSSQHTITGFKINPSYPLNPYIDIGGDSSTEDWQYSGSFRGAVRIDVKTYFQQVIDNRPGSVTLYVDNWGTRLLRIPVEMGTSSMGRLSLEGINITYNATITVGGERIVQEFNRVLPDWGEGKARVYIAVLSKSRGALMLSDLRVEYNTAPEIERIPDILIYEDSRAEDNTPVDLTRYARD
ncbi:MAG: VCBS repeat-containing protein, partial [Thermoplasmata archaeon]|nr:VCBS repeat-containing protein [Thermoplasmata archaeon]